MLGGIPVEIFCISSGEQGGLSAGAQEEFLGWAELRAQGVQGLAKVWAAQGCVTGTASVHNFILE